MRILSISLLLISILFISCSSNEKPAKVEPKAAKFPSGLMLAELLLNDSSKLKLPFLIENEVSGTDYNWYLRNDIERIPIGKVDMESDSFKVELAVFESEMDLHWVNGKLKGTWTKYKSDKRKIPITINPNVSERYPKTKYPNEELNGRWELHFSPDTEDEYPAIGIFNCNAQGMCTGTILTETGDYRYLVGISDERYFSLSTFDGAHAFLFKGKIEDGEIKANFYSGSTWQEPFTGKINPEFELKKASELTYMQEGSELKFSFNDLQGKEFSYPEDAASDAPTIIQILGSWCPNCMDETAMLVEMKKENPDLNIIGLAFERSMDTSIAHPNIRKMRKDLDINYPILLAGTWSKKDAAKKLPMLNAIISYPTLIMVNSDRSVNYIHTGFNGPGTGTAYQGTLHEIKTELAKLK